MNDIINMLFLGLLAGMIACLWTRVIKSNMIFRKFGKWLMLQNNRHLIEHATDSMLIKFIRCSYCLSVWLVLMFELFYIVDYNPYWLYCVIGTLGGLGSGNLVVEVVSALRSEN
jgi:hypothetical protein